MTVQDAAGEQDGSGDTGSGGTDSSGEALVIGTSVAHPARVYDYWLGGKDNFEADRQPASRSSRPTRI